MDYKKNLKLGKILQEIGDLNAIEPYSFNVMGLTTEFETEMDRVTVSIVRLDSFHQYIDYPPSLLQTDISHVIGYNAEFKINQNDVQFRKSDFRYLIRILKTVSEIIKETIIKNDSHTTKYQNVYCVGSISKLGQLSVDNQKDLIYRAITKKNLMPGYRIVDIQFSDLGIDGFAITKNGSVA